MENQSHQLLAQFSQHKTTRWKLKFGIHLHMKMGNLSLIRAYLWKRFPRSFSFGQFMSSRLYLLCVQSTACSLRSGNDHYFLENNRQETFWDLMFTLLMFDDKCNYVLKSSAKNRENDYPKCYFFFYNIGESKSKNTMHTHWNTILYLLWTLLAHFCLNSTTFMGFNLQLRHNWTCFGSFIQGSTFYRLKFSECEKALICRRNLNRTWNNASSYPIR